MTPATRLLAVLFDIDGTLVDSNDAHARAWVRAFAEHGIEVDAPAVRRCIGMGGDKLLPAVSGIDAGSPQGKAIAGRRGEIFTRELLPYLEPFRDSARLVAAIHDRGLKAVAATSATRDEVEQLLKIAGADALMHAAASGDDAESSKPDPDIIHAALQLAEVSAADAAMIGDTPYDVEAARRAGVVPIAFRCGGWDDADLRGAAEIYDGPWDLLARLDDSRLYTLTARVIRKS